MDEKVFKTSFENCEKIMEQIKKVIVGKDDAVRQLLVALISGGHVLIEDVPGVGKTTVAMALSKACGIDCKRIQFTPDVMASDITGFMMPDKKTGEFVYKPGVVMTNVLIADEINRTSPKTQSALLEVMEERRVTVDGVSRDLPKPFMVIATQNPVGYVGTYPLPEAQLDRFLMKISLGYPKAEEERKILADRKSVNPLSLVEAVVGKDEIVAMQQMITEIRIDDTVLDYIVALVDATRHNDNVLLAASPRASLALMQASCAYAFVQGRDYVTPADVAAMFPAIVEHRLVLTPEARIAQLEVSDVVAQIQKSIAVPMTR